MLQSTKSLQREFSKRFLNPLKCLDCSLELSTGIKHVKMLKYRCKRGKLVHFHPLPQVVQSGSGQKRLVVVEKRD